MTATRGDPGIHTDEHALRSRDPQMQSLLARKKLLELRIAELGAALRLKHEQSLKLLTRLQEREEAAVRRSEERFRLLVESVSDYAIVMLDADGRIVSWNDGAARITGYSEQDIVNRSVEALSHPQGVAPEASIRDENLEAARGSGRSESEGWLFRKTGEAFWASSAITALYDEERRLLGFATIIRDLTERKRAETALRKTAAELRRSNQDLEQFAYVASHDLQEPLRKIQAFGERLRARVGDAVGEEGADYIARMQSAAARMQTLIDDLLTFSRVTAAHGEKFGPVNLTEVAHEVVSDLESRIERVGGRVEIGALPTIDGDAGQLRRLFQNLIGNALKFHRPDIPPHVRVYATLSGPSEEPSQCLIYVEDNGIGFDSKYAERIFEIFQRLHGRAAYEGTGIGLAICRKVAERHGGTISARSTPGEGSSFTVTLPVRQADVRGK